MFFGLNGTFPVTLIFSPKKFKKLEFRFRKLEWVCHFLQVRPSCQLTNFLPSNFLSYSMNLKIKSAFLNFLVTSRSQ
jgi:hypothetical protein